MKNTQGTKKALIISITALIIIILDQLTKYLLTGNLGLGEQIILIQNFLYLTNVRNFGAGFSLFQGATQLIIWFSIIVIGVIIYLYDKIPKKLYVQLSTASLLGGIVGNLIDRFRLGYVIDYIDFRIWPTFNIADIAITAGVIGLIIYFLRKK